MLAVGFEEPLYAECGNEHCGWKGCPRDIRCHKCGALGLTLYNLPPDIDANDMAALRDYVRESFRHFNEKPGG